MQSRRTPFAQVVRPHMARLGALKNAGATEPRIAPRDFDAAEPFQLRATAYPGLPDAVCGHFSVALLGGSGRFLFDPWP